jgi:hypothetical protein
LLSEDVCLHQLQKILARNQPEIVGLPTPWLTEGIAFAHVLNECWYHVFKYFGVVYEDSEIWNSEIFYHREVVQMVFLCN